MIVKNCLNRCKRSITTTLSESVDRDMNARSAFGNRSHCVAYGKVIVIMSVELETEVWESACHLTEESTRLHWSKHTEGIRQHETHDSTVLEGIYHVIDILRTVLHAIAPVLKVDVHLESLLMRIVDSLLDICNMLVRSTLELLCAMFLRTFGKEIYDRATAFRDPIDRTTAITESEYLYPIQHTRTLRIATNHLNGFLLALADTCRGYLYTVNIDVTQQHTRYHEFLMRKE